MGQTSSIKQITRFLIYAIGLTAGILRFNLASAQDIVEPEVPFPTESIPALPAPRKTLPTIPAPPLPESVRDVPGTISVAGFKFMGNTVFSAAELNEAIADFTNRPVSFARLVQAANKITELYVSRGYVTTGAYIPAQSLESEIVEIQIVEGSLAAIEIDVTGRLKEKYVRDRLTSKISNPLNVNRLRSALQLLQLNPLIDSLNAELSSGIKPGTNILQVSVASADSFTVQTRLNNSRNLSIGTFERGLQLEEANLFGIGDRLSLAYDNTDGGDRYNIGYTVPINSRDGSLGVNLRWINNEIVQSAFESTEIEIESRNYDLTWRQPVLQRATPEISQELAVSLTAARRASDGTIMNEPEALTPGADENGEIRTSVATFGQEWLQRNRRQVIAARSQFSLGLDVLDATILPEDPDGQFFSWRGQFTYLRSLTESQSAFGSTLLLRSQLQLAADPLISTEQFSLGGATTVRGYRQDALLTDSGFLATTELRLPIARFSSIDATLQFTPFIDFGTGWNNDDEPTEFSTLIGTGFGLLLQTPERFSARVDWGIPLINRDDSGSSLQEDGIYFQLQYDAF